MFAYFGLVLVLCSWLAGLYLVTKWRGTYAMSISQHAASATGATKLFMGVLVILGASFYWWLVQWFTPQLGLSALFTYLLSLTILAQVITGIVPDTVGWRRRIHRSVALTMAALYIPLIYLILTAPNLTLAASIVGLMCVVYMATAILLFFFAKKAHNYYLIFQSLYIAAFQIIILSAAYI